MPPEFPSRFPKAEAIPPQLPDSRQHRGAFTNPFAPDASGRNVFQRGTEILGGTLGGIKADVGSGFGVRSGETGALGEAGREIVKKEVDRVAGVFNVQSIVVYTIASLLLIFGFLMLTKVGTTITVAAAGGVREGIGYQVRREASGRGSRARSRARRREEEREEKQVRREASERASRVRSRAIRREEEDE